MIVPKGFWIILGYAAALLFFGIIGYKTGSVVSLIAGASCSFLLLIACGGLLFQKRWGSYLLWTLMSLMTLMFIVRGSITHKPIPIFLAILSLAVFVALLVRNPSSKS